MKDSVFGLAGTEDDASCRGHIGLLVTAGLLGALALLVLVTLILSHDEALAQQAITPWSEPRFLASDPDQFRIRPFVVADSYGKLHAIWHEGGELARGGWRRDAILYASWDGTQWSHPVDVVAAPGGAGDGTAEARGLLVTPHDRLLIIQSEGGTVVISQAPLDEAANAHAWSSTMVDLGSDPTLAVSPDGEQWCVAFWVDAPARLLLTCSDDSGDSWAGPTSIWAADSGAAGNNAESLFAADGRVHLVWSEPREDRDWNSAAIWHAVFEPDSGDLSVREVMRSLQSDEPNLDNPALTECPDGQIHLFWNNSVGSRTGRFHEYSRPDGDVWSGVAAVFPGLSGLTSKAGFVCDNAGRVHLITAARGPETSGSPLRYATWFNGGWSQYSTLWGGDYYGERPSMVTAAGNQLHLVWDAFSGVDQVGGRFVAHAYRTIDAQEISAVAEDTSQNPTPPPDLLSDPPTIARAEPVLVRRRADASYPREAKVMESHPVVPILMGMAAACMMLGIGLVCTRRKR